MASESLGVEAAEQTVAAIATKALYASIVALLVGTGICAAINVAYAAAFFAGSAVGIINQRLQLKGAGKTIYLSPEKAAIYAQIKFYSRLGLTALMLGALMWIAKIKPVPLVIGFVITHAVTIAAIAIVFKKEIKDNA